jgi:predicted nuclease of predicted toxin-antitoxin system
MLRVLANENVPGPVVTDLRRRGHDVAWVAEDQRGASDDEVLTRAQRETRIVVTCDKDFGELAFVARLPAACGVVLLRLAGDSPAADNLRAVQALESRDDWAGHFAIVEDDRIRTRALPPG